MEKWYVYDRPSDSWSEGFPSREEAEAEARKEKYGTEAEVIKVEEK